MPAYAKDAKIVCFFQPAQKFKDAEVQDKVRDIRLQRPSEPRPRRDAADRLHADRADRRRRGKDRRTREESGELTTGEPAGTP
jgi:hypothetical protein